MTIIDELVAVLGFELDTRSDDARRRFEGTLNGIESRIGDLGVIAASTAAALVGIGASVFDNVAGAANATAEIVAYGDAHGVAFEQMQEFIFFADTLGISQKRVGIILDRVAGEIAQIKDGSDGLDVLNKLGITDPSKLSDNPVEFLQQIGDSLNDIGASKGETLNVAKKIGAREIGVSLNNSRKSMKAFTAESKNLGKFLSNQAGEDAQKFTQSLESINNAVANLKFQLLTGLLPAINPILKELENFTVKGAKPLGEALGSIVKGLIPIAEGIASAFVVVFNIFDSIAKLTGSFTLAAITIGVTAIGLKALLVGVFLAVGKSIAGATIAATLLNLRLLLIPIALLSVIGLIALAIEDLFLYFTDEKAETFTKRLLGPLDQYLGKLEKIKEFVDGFIPGRGDTPEVNEQVLRNTPSQAGAAGRLGLNDLAREQDAAARQGLTDWLNGVYTDFKKGLFAFGTFGLGSSTPPLAITAQAGNTINAAPQAGNTINGGSVNVTINGSVGITPDQIVDAVKSGVNSSLPGAAGIDTPSPVTQ